MQISRQCWENIRHPRGGDAPDDGIKPRAGRVVLSLILLAGLAGCGPAAPGTTPSVAVASGEFAGVTLTVACPDAAFASVFRQRAAAWASSTGATIQIIEQTAANAPDADAAIVTPAQMGTWAAQGKLATLPTTIRSGSRIPWDKLLDSYRKDLAGWGGVERGLPLAGDGYLLVYRADVLTDSRHLAALKRQSPQVQVPPRSWEDLAEIAACFAGVRGQPSLPPWADDDQLRTRFYQIAACYEREANNRGQSGAQGPAVDVRSLEFLFDLNTGKPRLTRPGFVAALEWMSRAQAFRPSGNADPAQALTDGSAVLGVLSLAELARLPVTAEGVVSPKFAIAPLPGTEEVFDTNGQKIPSPGGLNFVPYLGAAGKIGVVFQSGKQQSAAWSLLASSVGLASSLALLAEPKLGVGPFRNEHVYEDRCWLAYNFDPARTRKLTHAMQRYVGLELSNPTFPLRIPGEQHYQDILLREIRAALAGERTAITALGRANAEWEKLAGGVPAGEFLQQLKNSVGLQ